MFLEGSSGGERWSPEPSWRLCRSCKRLIDDHEPFAQVLFDHGAPRSLREANGTYHADCVRPILGLARALDTIRNFVR